MDVLSQPNSSPPGLTTVEINEQGLWSDAKSVPNVVPHSRLLTIGKKPGGLVSSATPSGSSRGTYNSVEKIKPFRWPNRSSREVLWLNRQADLQARNCWKLCEEGGLIEAVEALDLLLQRVSRLDIHLFYGLLKRCIGQKDLGLGRRVHALSVKSGYESDAFLANHIIRMYSSHASLEEARQVFTKVAAPNTHVWASIISGYADHGKPKEALQLYSQMCQSCMQPNSYVFVAVLKACATSADLLFGKKVHADILESAHKPNIFMGNCLVAMYSKCGSLLDARRVFDDMQWKDVVTWTTIIAGYVQNGLCREALTLYAEMRHEGIPLTDRFIFPCLLKACASVGALDTGQQLYSQIQERGLEADVVVGKCLINMYGKCGSLVDARGVFDNLQTKDVETWNTMIGVYAQQGFGQQALDLYTTMQQNCMTPVNRLTFIYLLQACANMGALHQGKQLHAQIQKRGFESDIVVRNCLVNMYAKCGGLEDARQVFDRLPDRDVVTWNAMIAGYAQHGLGQEALTLYASMQQDNMTQADIVTFVCLLKACANIGALQQGKQLHQQIVEKGMESDVVVGNCLVDMYAKCGRLDEAHRVFDALPSKDVVTWTTLLKGYAEHSNAQRAIQCFERMQQQGVAPDAATFVCLLVACSHEGLVNEGQRYFRFMVEVYGMSPNKYHYTCLVDLLGRAGRLDEAEAMLTSMPFENDIVAWISLLTACKSHGDLQRGRRCFERLITLEPGNSTAYVLLATMYANANRWRDAYEVEGLRKAAGAKKKAARAYIEVKNKVQEFTVGEERDDISSRARSMSLWLKQDGGHVPHTGLVLNVVSERAKEDALCGHAEKLALAYGLLNTQDGTTLLVTKSLRMCNDCHSTTKILSRLEKREIIVRDAHRVHCFVDGSCSCGDRH